MARRDDAFGGFSASPDGLPAFFTSASVDDKKYESLLEDLRAHDLLGPADADDTTASAPSLGGSSLFFNDAFSAVFMGNFNESTLGIDAKPAPTATTASKPPPGFARAPPGLAPTETDLKWARGQQAFSQLASSSNQSAFSSGKDDASDDLDATELPSLKALGLDDDDVVTPPKPASVAPPPGVPAPSAIPPPPNAWQQQLPPPPAPPQHQQQQQQQYQPGPPPPPHGPPPPGMHHPQHPPHPQYGYPQAPHGRGPPPPMHPMHMGGPPPPPFMHGPPPPHMHMHHMRGPHPPPPPPGGPGGMPYPPPMMQMPPPNFAPRFKMMTPRDINFVVQAQTKWIRSSDPFSDDYYFHNYVQKRSRGPVPRPGGRGLPLPSWKLEHIKSVDTVDSSRAAKSREWESENHVLGRNNTRSLYRPRQLLNFATDSKDDKPSADSTEASSTSPGDAAESSEEPSKPASSGSSMVVKAKKQVFGSDLWNKRTQIDRGLQCLLSLQDARHLLDARGVNVQQFHSMDAQSMDPALAELRTRTTTLLLELASLLGVAVSPTAEEAPVSCNVEQLHRILSVAKGKRLMSRALPLLHPSARFVLLPQLIEFLLSAQGVSKISSGEASTPADDEDERLCQTIVLTLLYHPPAPSAELLTDCLTRAMEGHDLQTLRVLLYNRGRAEALQALLQRGGASINEAASDETKQQWHRAQESFVALATAIKQAA